MITFELDGKGDASDCADELRRIASLIDQGYTSGEVHGGSWSMASEDSEDEDT